VLGNSLFVHVQCIVRCRNMQLLTIVLPFGSFTTIPPPAGCARWLQREPQPLPGRGCGCLLQCFCSYHKKQPGCQPCIKVGTTSGTAHASPKATMSRYCLSHGKVTCCMHLLNLHPGSAITSGHLTWWLCTAPGMKRGASMVAKDYFYHREGSYHHKLECADLAL
jgi:hypothetical protein